MFCVKVDGNNFVVCVFLMCVVFGSGLLYFVLFIVLCVGDVFG